MIDQAGFNYQISGPKKYPLGINLIYLPPIIDFDPSHAMAWLDDEKRHYGHTKDKETEFDRIIGKEISENIHNICKAAKNQPGRTIAVICAKMGHPAIADQLLNNF
ncbi:MAG: hypothetical protein EOO20_28490 [Chryseobacterium sp.]|nr:MAG: hypothetical protein EOO20_28490 [Chryseobacterium sp.]